MNVEKIDMAKLKEMATKLNKATYENEEGEELSFVEKNIKTTAVTKEGLAKAFDEAVRSIDDEIVNDLPEDIIDFYNEFFAEGAEEAESEPEKPAKKDKPAKAEKPTKEKAPKAEKPTKEKKQVELSCFGHKVGSQAAALDDLLAPGKPISLDDLVKKSGRSALGVKSHVKHLQEARGLAISEKDGVYQLVVSKKK
jgi:hypothetical protein